jgi:glycosyltransferase involved in cell wall biosynthesis
MTTMPTPISAIILTKNEARQLPECMATLQWADEILVVDSFSTDDTVAIASAAGARVLQHPFSNFAAQHNYAQSQAAHNWVLFVDADERVSGPLRDEIVALAQADRLAPCTAYHFERVHLVSGRWLFSDSKKRRLTPRQRADIRRREVPRLLDRRHAVWTRPLHEEVRAPEPHGVLNGVLCHLSGSNLSAALESFNYYTDLEAAYLHRGRRQPVTLWEAAARGARAFAFHYVLRGGFRYGQHGLLQALSAGITKYMNYAKLWERQLIERDEGQWSEADRQLLKRYYIEDEDQP